MKKNLVILIGDCVNGILFLGQFSGCNPIGVSTGKDLSHSIAKRLDISGVFAFPNIPLWRYTQTSVPFYQFFQNGASISDNRSPTSERFKYAIGATGDHIGRYKNIGSAQIIRDFVPLHMSHKVDERMRLYLF